MDLQLGGRVAWVTGAGGGIGSAIVTALADEGATVALSGRRAESLEAVARGLSEAGVAADRLGVFPTDVTDAAAVSDTAAAIAARWGRLDIVVNAAGAPGGLANGPLEALDPVEFLEDIDQKLVSCLRTARAAVPLMRRGGWGRLIHVAGNNARRAGNYSGGARNIAMIHMSKTLADELGPQNITSNVVHPGATHGAWWSEQIERLGSERGLEPSEVEAQFAAQTSLERLLDPEELASVVAFLASPRSGPITGESIGIGGGVRGQITL